MILAVRVVVLAIICLIVWMLVRAHAHRPKESPVISEKSQPAADIAVNIDRAVHGLSRAIQVKTISHADLSLTNYREFERFHFLLESIFPLVHSKLKKKAIGYNLIYQWKGQDSAKRAVALMSHMDVVPATEKGWKYPAFSGAVEEGYVWGRGALDIKYGLIGILEAIEELLELGYTPSRDIYVISTADEEAGQKAGIMAVSEVLQASGVELEWVLDEGGIVGEGMMDGFPKPIALVGVAEKGYVDLELAVEVEGGHSSYPGKDTAIGILCRAIAKVEAVQMKSRLGSPVREFFDGLGRHMSFGARLVFANSDILEPLILKQMLKNAQTAALIRTTTAPTVISGGVKSNVLPPKAKAIVNFRLLPGDTTQDVVNHVSRVINDDRVKLTVLSESPASKISSSESEGFRLISQCIHEQFPEAVIAPYLVVGGTDAKMLEPLAEGVYRFTPYRISKDELAGMHGVNERVSIENLEKAVRFYASLIMNI